MASPPLVLLQNGGDYDIAKLSDATWCFTQVDGRDTMYVSPTELVKARAVADSWYIVYLATVAEIVEDT